MGYQAQQMQLEKAYENMPMQKSIPTKGIKVTETIEVKTPDMGDRVYVLVRTYAPDWLFILIVVAGLYGIFHKPINIFLTNIIGFNFDDLKQVVKRRKERDEELKNGGRS